ncbi:MAG: DUF2336 domain-containing protein [Salinarimonas sp.]|nr:DUF2336 domain-containing protein [Salinarimonas sp.]
MEHVSEQAETIEARLELLARQGGGYERALDLLVDVLIERGPQLCDIRRDTCIDLIMDVAPSCGAKPIAEATRRMALHDHAPRTLILALAQLAIAREAREAGEKPVPPSAPQPDDALTRLIAQAPAEELRNLARREDLHPGACAKLLERGDGQAIAACARNRNARFDRSGFAEVAAMAAENNDIRAALCHRWDIPEDEVARFWGKCVDHDKARLLVSGFSAEDDPLLGEAPASVLTLEEDAALETERQLAELILEHTRPSSLPRAARNLAEAAGIDEGLAFDLICGSYERGVVLLARAANMDEWAFLKLVCSRLKQIASTTTPHRALRNFRECSRDEARRILSSIGDVKGLCALAGGAAKAAAKAAAKTARILSLQGLDVPPEALDETNPQPIRESA